MLFSTFTALLASTGLVAAIPAMKREEADIRNLVAEFSQMNLYPKDTTSEISDDINKARTKQLLRILNDYLTADDEKNSQAGALEMLNKQHELLKEAIRQQGNEQKQDARILRIVQHMLELDDEAQKTIKVPFSPNIVQAVPAAYKLQDSDGNEIQQIAAPLVQQATAQQTPEQKTEEAKKAYEEAKKKAKEDKKKAKEETKKAEEEAKKLAAEKKPSKDRRDAVEENDADEQKRLEEEQKKSSEEDNEKEEASNDEKQNNDNDGSDDNVQQGDQPEDAEKKDDGSEQQEGNWFHKASNWNWFGKDREDQASRTDAGENNE